MTTWTGVDLGGFLDAAEVEHRVLGAVGALEALGVVVDHVVTHALPGRVPRVGAALRVVGPADGEGLGVAAELHGRLGGTLAVPAGPGGRPVVLGDPAAAGPCLDVAAASRGRRSGRCVRFPGQDRLTGVVPVRRILERSAIGRVAGSGWPVAADDLVDTRGFLRPTFEAGDLVLRVGPAAGGVLLPTEIPHPHECCGNH